MQARRVATVAGLAASVLIVVAALLALAIGVVVLFFLLLAQLFSGVEFSF